MKNRFVRAICLSGAAFCLIPVAAFCGSAGDKSAGSGDAGTGQPAGKDKDKQLTPASPAKENAAGSASLAEALSHVELIIEPQDMVIKGRHGLKIQVKNQSDRALLFGGDKATAKIGETEFSCMDIRDFDELFATPPAFASSWSIGAGQTLKSALTVGTWQAGGDIFKSSRGGILQYGKDEERRQDDENRFGQRVLWPGETSSGVLLFRCEQPLAAAKVTLPVSSFFNSKERSFISGSSSLR